MKKSIVLLVIIIAAAFSSISFPQETEVQSNPKLTTFNFYLINGYAVSYNFLHTKTFYLRAHLDLHLTESSMDSEGESTDGSNDWRSRRTMEGDSEDSYLLIGFSPQIVFPIYSSHYGSAYIGAGPNYRYSRMKYGYNEDRVYYSPDTTSSPSYSYNTYSNTIKRSDLSLLLLLGVKANISENINLFAETHFNGGRRWSDSENRSENRYEYGMTYTYTTSTEEEGWFYELQFVRMGVSLAF